MPLARLAERCPGRAQDPSLEELERDLLAVHAWHIDLREDVEGAGRDVAGDAWHGVEPLAYEVPARLELRAHLLWVLRVLLERLEHGMLHCVVGACGHVVLHLGQLGHELRVRR